MNKMIIATIIATVAAVILTGCAKVENSESIDNAWCYHGMGCYTKAVEIEGHKYIIMDDTYSGAIIHAASCECVKK